MYGEALGPVLATALLGAGAPDPLVEEPCGGPACGGETRATQPGAGAHGLLSSRARGGVYELPSHAAPEPAPATAPSPRAAESSGEQQYDVGGLADTNSLRASRLAQTVRLPAATAFAAPLIATDDTCMGSRSFGIQVGGWGISIATTWQDRNCRRLKNARALATLGYREAAVQLLCMDDEVFAAMERAGTPCPGVRRVTTQVEPVDPPEPEAEPPLATYTVLFDFDSARLRPEADAVLAPLLAMLQADPDLRIEIEGHTCSIGTDAYNQGLSQRRAQAVVEWLVARGISRDRIRAAGRGESEPAVSNDTEPGRRQNRRVEVRRWAA